MARGYLEKRLREAWAMARQVRYLPYDWGLRPPHAVGVETIGERVSVTPTTIVLLHGLYASAGVLRPLRRQLETLAGVETVSFSYGLGPGIVELAERVVGICQGAQGRLCLVGHSLGGLVACYAAHHGALRDSVHLTVSLAAPFRGSRRAWLVPGQAGRDIELGSPLLELIRKGPSGGVPCPHLSLTAKDDELIEPGSIPEFGTHLSIRNTGHNGILFDERAISAVVREVDRVCGQKEASRAAF